MPFLSRPLPHKPEKPLFIGVLANTFLSTVPGLSGAGPSPEGSLLVPNLDAELIVNGRITSCNVTPNTKTGCPTPASITRSVLELCDTKVIFCNAGLVHPLTVPSLDLCGLPGQDPRITSAVPSAYELYTRGVFVGNLFSGYDTLIIGECVPGGTTTALCVLRALGYHALVSSASIQNPSQQKEEIVNEVLNRISGLVLTDPISIIKECGDPMMAVVAGIVHGFSGLIYLAGGTQMLAVAAINKRLNQKDVEVITTVYVRDDPSANCSELADNIGVQITYVDPGFGDIGHKGLVRYGSGEVKEGMGAGGAMYLASMLGSQPEEIRRAILAFVTEYCS